MTGSSEEAERADEAELDETGKRESGFPAQARGSLRDGELAARVAVLEAEVTILRECIRQQCRMPSSMDEGQVLPTSAQITADCQLDAEDGFHDMEYDGAGRPYRWTGPSRLFGVDVLLDRREPRTLTADFAASLAPENVEGLRAFCGAEELDVSRTAPAGSSLGSVTAKIPARAPGGQVRLWFAVPRVVAPSELDVKSTDERPLGIAFVALRVQ